jgi:hypothetical protein
MDPQLHEGLDASLEREKVVGITLGPGVAALRQQQRYRISSSTSE